MTSSDAEQVLGVCIGLLGDLSPVDLLDVLAVGGRERGHLPGHVSRSLRPLPPVLQLPPLQLLEDAIYEGLEQLILKMFKISDNNNKQ